MALPMLAGLLGLGGGPSVRPGIRIEGHREFNRAVSRAVDRDLPKRIGQVHKEVGRLVISKLPAGDPAAVGRGAGAAVRPSATRREVILRVGGAHRARRASEYERPMRAWWWGRGVVNPPSAGRPNIIGTAVRHQDEITRMLFDGIERALRPPFS